jgi:RimJ/RimL family protein N-acetyltransferase
VVVDDPFANGLPLLEGDRVRLRAPRATDLSAVLDIFGDRETLAYWSHGPLEDAAAARAYLQRIDDGWRSRELFQWAVAASGSDAMLGTVSLYDWDPAHRRAWVGFILGRRHWGRGLARDALTRLEKTFEAIPGSILGDWGR